jgi:hypothetical protein
MITEVGFRALHICHLRVGLYLLPGYHAVIALRHIPHQEISATVIHYRTMLAALQVSSGSRVTPELSVMC